MENMNQLDLLNTDKLDEGFSRKSIDDFSYATGGSEEYNVAVSKQKEIVANKKDLYENAKNAASVALDRLSKSNSMMAQFSSIKSSYNVAKQNEDYTYKEYLAAQSELARLEGYSNKDSYEKALKEAKEVTAAKKADYEKAKLKVEEIKSKMGSNPTSTLLAEYNSARDVEKSTNDVYVKVKSQLDELERYYKKNTTNSKFNKLKGSLKKATLAPESVSKAEIDKGNQQTDESGKEKNVSMDSDDGKILGMPKTAFWIGVGVMALIGGVFVYKKFIKK